MYQRYKPNKVEVKKEEAQLRKEKVTKEFTKQMQKKIKRAM